MIATGSQQLTTKDLTATLDHLGVHFVVGEANIGLSATINSPNDLLAGLASSHEARIRLALIPLFLCRPFYADYVPESLSGLSKLQSHTLCCFYTAALLLQEKHHAQLAELFGEFSELPSLFEQALELDTVTCPDTRLRQLAQKQTELTGKTLNWYGTYQHAYNRLIQHETRRQQWQT